MYLRGRRHLVIATLALVATLVVPPIYLQAEDESLLVSVSATTWKNTSVVKIENSNDNVYDIKLVWITLDNGTVSSFKSIEGWSAEIGSNPNTIQFRTDTSPILPGQSASFGIKSDQSQPIFRWIILDENGDELGSGLLDVARSEEERKNLEDELLKKEDELRQKEQELLAKERELLEREQELMKREGGAVTDGLGGGPSEEVIVPSVPPKISLRSDVAQPGEAVKILGEGFTPDSRLTVLFDGNRVATLDVTSDGTVRDRVAIPEDAVEGAHQISVSDSRGRAANIVLTVELETEEFALSTAVERELYRQGDLVKVTGTGKPGGAVLLTVKNPTGLEILSIAVAVENDGTFTAFIPLSGDATPGNYQVIVFQEETTSETSYNVQTTAGREMSVLTDKLEYKRGENVLVSGKASPSRDVLVMIFSPDGSEVLSTIVRADETGNYEALFPLSGVSPLGEYSAKVKIDEEEIAIVFTVIGGSISLTVQTDKQEYRDGELVRISGHGKANDKVSIVISTPKEEEIRMSAITKDDGTYTAIWLVSSVAEGGKYAIIAEQGDEKAETAFKVSE